MKTLTIAIAFTLLVVTLPICAPAVSAPTNASHYEELPELKASEILQPDILQAARDFTSEAIGGRLT